MYLSLIKRLSDPEYKKFPPKAIYLDTVDFWMTFNTAIISCRNMKKYTCKIFKFADPKSVLTLYK